MNTNNDAHHEILMTAEGLKELKEELHELKENKRPKGVQRLQTAREMGDLSENSEYSSATQDLAFIDGRISEIEEIIRHAKVAKTDHKQVVRVGSKVSLNTNGKDIHYLVVGEWEADPKEKKISHNSPLGKALIGKKVGEAIEVEAPAGTVQYKIKAIK
jgi:transcription elongation factor GreA